MLTSEPRRQRLTPREVQCLQASTVAQRLGQDGEQGAPVEAEGLQLFALADGSRQRPQLGAVF